MPRHPFDHMNGKLGPKSTARKQAHADRNAAKEAPKAATITVRLDHRTTITLASEKALAFWRQRYPNLTIITKPE